METNKTTFGEFVAVYDCLTDECKEENKEILNKAEKPEYIFGKKVPEDLKSITFGQYSDLCDVFSQEQNLSIFSEVAKILFDATDEEISNASVQDIWGLGTFAAKEIGSINNLFGDIRMDYTEQEKKAGIEKLQFGTFGILDWYARRMGIHDQNLVNNEKWVRIYQCMKNDMEDAKFQRRLQKVYEQEAKRK